ncbi:hypothetical protein D3C86_1527600 [compost metagenome]
MVEGPAEADLGVEGDVVGDEDGLGVVDGARDRHRPRVRAPGRVRGAVATVHPVGDQHRGAEGLAVEAVRARHLQVAHRLDTPGRASGVGVGDEGVGPGLAHLLDQAPQDLGADVGGVARLAEVGLDRDAIARGDDLGEARRVEKLLDLVHEAPPAGRSALGEVDFSGHAGLL